MRRLYRLLLISFLLLNISQIKAVPAYPYPTKIQQADGSYLSILMKGDEFFHFQVTEDGFPIIKNQNGNYNYAKIDENGILTDTNIKAKDKNSRSFDENIYIQNLNIEINYQKINSQQKSNRLKSLKITKPAKFPISGTPRSLVILVNFSNKSFVVNNSQVAFTNLLNENGYSTNGGTGSAKDYFRDNSMGVFNPQFDVVGPFTLPQNISYYGQNDTKGYDQNPAQMIIDACSLASQNGVNFANYDTDNDGNVDNVFVYYAGYNEAENGPDDTIWPHRWGIYPGNNYTGTEASRTFNGKKVTDYACTSELRGTAGSNMCGIGTFCHEFGHVLGLVDFYATNGATHQTLSYWDIMDAGPYLNSGRTPPSYSAHERFYLGWLTPTELKSPSDVKLEPLHTTNKAYIITQNGNSNLNGANPSPTEYFLLENRQNKGWDKYLPGHGMLISRVNFSFVTWNDNSPNNDPNSMGVDIIEADGIGSDQTLAGDPFPGTSIVTSYKPLLRSGALLTDKPITFISEKNDTIFFRFKGGINAPQIIPVSNITQFNTIQGTPSDNQTITLSGKKLVGDIYISFGTGTHFQIKKTNDTETAWGKTLTLTQVDSIVNTTQISIRYNPTVPSYKQTHNDILQFTSNEAETMRLNLIGKSSRPVYVRPPIALNATDITYGSFVAQWKDTTNDAKGYYFSAYSIEDGKNVYVKDIQGNDIDSLWTTSTSETLYNLISDKDYFYVVRASDKNTTYSYENITEKSNVVKIKTLPYTSEKILRVVSSEGKVKIFPPSKNSIIKVYNLLGQQIMSLTAGKDILEISTLPRGQVYIIQSEKLRAKIIL